MIDLITYKNFLRIVIQMAILLVVSNATSTAQSTIPFTDLLEDRFSIEMMGTSTETCEIRSCTPLIDCDAAIASNQAAYIAQALDEVRAEITTEVEVICEPGEVGTETTTEVALDQLILPFTIYRVQTCDDTDAYIASDKIAGLSSPYEVVQEIVVRGYDQRFELGINGATVTVDLEQLLMMLFVEPRSYTIDISGYTPCNEEVCEQSCGTCTNAERVAQDRAIEYLRRETEVVDVNALSYPLTMYRLCICGGRSLWVMEDEIYVFYETSYIKLDSVTIHTTATSVAVPDLPTDEEIADEVTYEDVAPTCDNPSDGSITIKVSERQVDRLTQYSIDGGATFQNSPLFAGLTAGDYNIAAASDDGSISISIPSTLTLTETCEENTPEKCSDGIDNDNDGLLDCDDDECVAFFICSEDECELLDVITPEIAGANQVVLSVLEDGDPTPAQSKLQRLGLDKVEYLAELRSYTEITYEFVERFGTDTLVFRDTSHLVIDDELDDIFQWQQRMVLDIPFNAGSSINRRTKSLKSNAKSASDDCVQIATPRSLCSGFSAEFDFCAIQEDNVIAGVFINGGTPPYEITFSSWKILNLLGFEVPVLTYFKSVVAHNNDFIGSLKYAPYYVVSIKDANDCGFNEQVAISWRNSANRERKINIERGRCFSLAELLEDYTCGGLYDRDPSCLTWSSDDYDIDDDEICPDSEGRLSYVITIAGEVLAEGEMLIQLTEKDLNGNGIADADDPCDFEIFSPDYNQNGIPDACDCDEVEYMRRYSQGDIDIDKDGEFNCNDPDVDGDGILNAYDPDIDGDGIPNGRDPDIDGDGIGNNVDPDADGDGYYADDPYPLGTDTEDCNTPGDQDGDGLDDDEDPDCSPQNEICCGGKDEDGDGLIDERDPDCTIPDLILELELLDPDFTSGASVLKISYDDTDLDFQYKICIGDDCRTLISGMTTTVTSPDYEIIITNSTNCYINYVISGEICDNGVDDDGDGYIDCRDKNCIGYLKDQLKLKSNSDSLQCYLDVLVDTIVTWSDCVDLLTTSIIDTSAVSLADIKCIEYSPLDPECGLPSEECSSTVLCPENSCGDYFVSIIGMSDEVLASEVIHVKEREVDYEFLNCAFPDTDSARLEGVAEAFNLYKEEFEINTPIRIAHFLGQMGFESKYPPRGLGPFEAFEEVCSYSEAAIKGSGWGRRYCHFYVGFEDVNLTDCVHACNIVDTTMHKVGFTIDSINSYRVKPNFISNCSLFDFRYGCNHQGNGNGAPSTMDGSRYAGRGLVHLTGRDNFSQMTNIWNADPNNVNDQKDFLNADYADTYTDLNTMMKIAMYFWTDASTLPRDTFKINPFARNLNELAVDSTECTIDEVGVGINGRDSRDVDINGNKCGDPRDPVGRRLSVRAVLNCLN